MNARRQATRVTRGGPFDLSDDAAYVAWRRRKLRQRPHSTEELLVDIDDPTQLTLAEYVAVLERVRRANMALYGVRDPGCADKGAIQRLGARFGLHHLDTNLCADEDSITTLRVVSSGRHQGYIPYTNRPLNWHTDGYYNPPANAVRAIVLHCVTPAREGGENGLLDHELAYLLMRDEDPRYVEALMQDDVMTIPPNEDQGQHLRGAQTGPVFSVDAGGALHMRYTARTRSIQWKDDPWVHKARVFLSHLLEDGSPYLLWHRLAAGQGLISNNVIHCRRAFEDAPQRVLYRARYHDRIEDPACSTSAKS